MAPMAETLIAWYTRFNDDPKKVGARLKGRPVLLFEPPLSEEEGSDDSLDDFQFRTSAGDSVISPKTGEAVVAIVEKTKDNAFQRRVTIGRTTNNDIVLDDVSVSRFHAWLQYDEGMGAWTVIDAQSRNGTMLNGKRVAAKAAAALVDGAVLRVGNVQLKFFSEAGFVKYLETRSKE